MTRMRTLALVAALLALGCLTSCDPPPRTGIWTSTAEVQARPTSGAAWNALASAARGSWGHPDLADNNSTHDTSTLAGALYAVRTGDQTMVDRVRASVLSVIDCDCYARALEASRNITSYVLAADLVGLPDADRSRFATFLTQLRTKPLQGHSGGNSIEETALLSANNWSTMARAAMVAIDLYIGDRTDLDRIAASHRAWLGDDVANDIKYTSTNWHAPGAPVGVNRRGATIAGHPVDGVLPEDQRRTGEFTWLPPKGSYPYEALQGAVLTGYLLDRAGVAPFDAGDDALGRAVAWLYGPDQNPASGDDLNTIEIVDAVTGATYPTPSYAAPGKNICCMSWLLP